MPNEIDCSIFRCRVDGTAGVVPNFWGSKEAL